MKSFQNINANPRLPVGREGSTLLIVVALLGMLAFLGFVFYTFAKQERATAVSFSQGAQTLKPPSLEPDALWDFALQQIILGPPDGYFQSILWGGRHSLLANMFGRDGIPWNGEGVNLIQNASGQPFVDMNYDGTITATDNQNLLHVVDSPVGNPGVWNYGTAGAFWDPNKRFGGTASINASEDIPEPDVNYNYPDINSLFLSYDGTAVGVGGANPTRVIIPSFLRPQYFRTTSGATTSVVQNWYQNMPANQIMRPHPGHVCVDSNGNTLTSGGTQIPRYTTLSDYKSANLRRPFTFGQGASAFAPDVTVGQPSTGNLGVWTVSVSQNANGGTLPGFDPNDLLGFDVNDLFGSTTVPVQQLQYRLDVDTDGDGINDAILMDLGYPPVRRGDGKLVVPLFAISIRDLNGLLNVNATGNLSGNVNLSSLSAQNQLAAANTVTQTDQLGFRPNGSTVVAGQSIYSFVPDNISKSNQGLSSYETNAGRALTANPLTDFQLASSEAAYQLGYFLRLFDSTVSPPQAGRSIAELANLEWLLLNVGRPSVSLGFINAWMQANPGATTLQQTVAIISAITDIYPGRNGETVRASSTIPSNASPLPAYNSTSGAAFNSVPSVATSPGQIVSYTNPNPTGAITPPPLTGNPNIVNYTQSYTANASDVPAAAMTRFLTTLSPYDLPKPGLSGTWWLPSTTQESTPVEVPINGPVVMSAIVPDDNLDYNTGEPNTVSEPSATSSSRWVTPLDFRGSGQLFQRYSWGADGQPGNAGVDDDGDGIFDNTSEEGWQGSDDLTASFPSSYGKYINFTTLNNSPLFFPTYSGYHSYYSAGNPFYPNTNTSPPSPPLPLAGGVRWGDYGTTPGYYATIPSASSNPQTSLLMRGSVWSSLLDDQTEMIVDPTIMSPGYLTYLRTMSTSANASTPPLAPGAVTALTNTIANDAVFGPEEMLLLQGTNSDARLSDSRSRLAELMPGNLVASQAAPDIRKRLTTVSSDRREYGWGRSLIGGLRSWEWVATGGFPTGFPPCITVAPTPNPYRAELYNYLQPSNLVHSSATTSLATNSTSLKLDVNRYLFLDSVTLANNGIGQYGFAPLPEQTSITDTNATTARQNMARDIYTLLYTLCFVHTDGTNVDIDYRLVPAANVPTLAQAKEMAQFAVNLVDSLDPDNIITAFYYDPDLTDNVNANGLTNAAGWDPIGFKGPDGQEQTADDFVVYGVERQMLTFNEVCAFTVSVANPNNTKLIFTNTPSTSHTYLFFELQNVSPMNVTLASTGVTAANAVTNADWRIRLTSADESTQYNILYFLPGLNSSNYLKQDANGNWVLNSGATFSVASQDGNDTLNGNYRTSDYRANPGDSGTGGTGPYTLVVPQIGADGLGDPLAIMSTTPTTSFSPRCNLDLVWSYPDAATRFTMLNNSSGPGGVSQGSFISQLVGKTSARLHLERRAAAGLNPANPGDAAWQSSVWVPVDKTSNTTSGGTADFTVQTISPTTPNVNLLSYPRSLPLLRGSVPAGGISGTTNSFNCSSKVTIDTTTQDTANSIVWQLQNDRDFTSLGELMQLPLYGPDQLTAAIAEPVMSGTALTVASSTPTLPNPPPARKLSVATSEFYSITAGGKTTYFPALAAGRFLRPDNPDYAANTPPTTNNGNRWYRLFDFLEVRNRSHQHPVILGTPPLTVGNTVANPNLPSVSFGAMVNAGTPSVNAGTPAAFGYPGTPGSTTYPAFLPYSPMFGGPFNLPQYFGWPRVHGQVNLNTMRHPQVLLGVLDDDQTIFDPRYYAGGGGNLTPFLDSVDPADGFGSTNAAGTSVFRQWWIEFIKSRDSRFTTVPATAFQPDPLAGTLQTPGNPFNTTTNPAVSLFLPGTANARPFRGLDAVGPLAIVPGYVTGTPPANTEDSPLENTILRSLPMDSLVAYASGTADASPDLSRRLFEVGNHNEQYGQITAEMNPPAGSDLPLHPSARYRLLSKLMNNTTTRSNTFAIYVTVQYYEASQVVSDSGVPATRIGGLLDDAPVHRGFFVVDRTGAIEQMKAIQTNITNGTITPPTTTFPVSGASYSFQPNTDATGTQSNMNGIRWKDLILYRQTLN